MLLHINLLSFALRCLQRLQFCGLDIDDLDVPRELREAYVWHSL